MCSKYKYHSELLQADKTDELSKSLCMVQYTTTKVKKYRGIHGYINNYKTVITSVWVVDPCGWENNSYQASPA